ncbi:NADP-dependent oxidoreductase domain-containing protein [Lentinula lateritia]|uniref:NADP-dependent oxidoreductase domain-containing protein n=1 Tax=Lentinula lateritia TaxID=40482 RepID=A0ABQ8VJN4_9AGAR|nr:NADP-dependent oxidoreductase domain-containing protein [Lentinula lateritia]
MVTQKSQLNIVMGAMTFGKEGTNGARVHDVKDVEAILDEFSKRGHTEIDTARVYCAGTSEEILGQIDWKAKGLKLETKLVARHTEFAQFSLSPPLQHIHIPYPIVPRNPISKPDPNATPNQTPVEEIYHTYEDLNKHLLRSLKALNTETPYEVTMKAVNDLYKEGYFKKFAISNYMAWEVAEIVGICKANGYILPSAYQGIYNAVHRAAEPELFPCLRKFGISSYIRKH